MESPITSALDDLIRRSAPPQSQARPPVPEEDLKQFKPAPEPEHAQLDEATSRRLTSMTPSAQYKWASRTLTESAESRAGLTIDQAALISHVIASNETIRDNMVMDVVGAHIKCDRLVQAFRVADDARRSAMAGLAAAALYLNGHHPDNVHAVARHTSDKLARQVALEPTLRFKTKEAFGSMSQLCNCLLVNTTNLAFARTGYPNPPRSETIVTVLPIEKLRTDERTATAPYPFAAGKPAATRQSTVLRSQTDASHHQPDHESQAGSVDRCRRSYGLRRQT